MSYRKAIEAAGIAVEPLMVWALPGHDWEQPPCFEMLLDRLAESGEDYRLTGCQRLRFERNNRYSDYGSLDFGDPRVTPPVLISWSYTVTLIRTAPASEFMGEVDPGKMNAGMKRTIVAIDTVSDRMIWCPVLVMGQEAWRQGSRDGFHVESRLRDRGTEYVISPHGIGMIPVPANHWVITHYMEVTGRFDLPQALGSPPPTAGQS